MSGDLVVEGESERIDWRSGRLFQSGATSEGARSNRDCDTIIPFSGCTARTTGVRRTSDTEAYIENAVHRNDIIAFDEFG